MSILIKILVIIDPKSDAAKLRNFATSISDELVQKTKSIMDDVEKYGDSALLAYTEKFDGIRLNSLTPQISAATRVRGSTVPSFEGGDIATILLTPATFAGVAHITILLG